MKSKNSSHHNQTPRNLFLLLMIFVFGLGSQTILNLTVSNVTDKLDKKIRNTEVESLLIQEIIVEIHKIEAGFFQMTGFPNKHQRRILVTDIQEQKNKIEQALKILNKGGRYQYNTDTSFTSLPEQIQFIEYTPDKATRSALSSADLLSKFIIIEKHASQLNQQLDYIDMLSGIGSTELGDALDGLKLEVKLLSPLFDRIKQDIHRTFDQSKLNANNVFKEAEKKKQLYSNLQFLLTGVVFWLGLLAFYTLSRNIKKTTQQIQSNQDYTQDILDSQSNMIIINDGKNIIGVSGGFFDFFSDYYNLEDFAKDFSCICDLFIKEEGLIYKFDDKNWIDYLLEHPDKVHKVKIKYNDKLTTFQINAVKSEKYKRYIISMFDISENEQITADLAKQKDKALAATQAKSDFLANMSHEIRTPLNAILGFIGLLKEKNHDVETQKYLNTIDSSSHSLLGIINDILDFSKIESGKLNIDPVEFNPRKEFLSTADLFKARCSEKNLSFNIELSDDVPSGLKSDVLRIKQVLANLISNAIKFTEANKNIYLTIRYDAGQLFCSVKDEGIGISEEALKHIFEAFSQAESSTTRKYGGTGLGLAISSKLISMLGGELKVTSTLGQGSCFFFQIPVEVTGLKQETEEKYASNTQLQGKILLVEDNKTNQMLMSAIIQKQGLAFDIAEDGQQAVEAIKSHRYDLVLMDENMPVMNGIEATKRIRTWERDTGERPTPIIALTANAMTGDRKRFLAAGMDDYLTKPVNIPKLIKVFNWYLQSQD